VKYDSYIPADPLKPYVSLLAISESDYAGEYKVLPGTEIVIGFQYKGSLSHIKDNNKIPLSGSGLTGIHDSFRVFSNKAGTGTVLVYFKEGMAPGIFKQPMHELFGESLSMDHFMLLTELLILEEKLHSAIKDSQRIVIVEDFLISKINQHTPDILVLSAISIVYKEKGNIRIKEVAEKLHISQGPLEKRFRHSVGTSPKKFASIVRLKSAIKNYDAGQSLTAQGYEAGFYDQAHFIKEFKNFTGENPESFFHKDR
jgi:AraC-like DNA-binding protein